MCDAGFELRKWVTKNPKLSLHFLSQEKIIANEQEDVSFCDTILPSCDEHTTLPGLRWDTRTDELVFNFSALIEKCCTMKKTKRGLLSMAATAFDSLGVCAPITARIKTIFQMLCTDKLACDDKIPDAIYEIWNKFLMELTELKEIRLQRFVLLGSERDLIEIHGFSDSSKEVYSAVLYLRIVSGNSVKVSLLASTTRVAPLKQLTIPRLELLGCLLLSRLVKDVMVALKDRVSVENMVFWSDSQVSLAWIIRKEKRWKPWVENRVVEFRKVVACENWKFVKGELNPADIPTRLSKYLIECFSSSWFSGPSSLRDFAVETFQIDEGSSMEDVLSEAKNSFKGDIDEPVTMTVTNIDNDDIGLAKILDPKGMSSLQKLVIITALVTRFIGNLSKKAARQDINNDEMDADEYQDALTRWIKEEQRLMQHQANFGKIEKSLKLFNEDDNILRLRGRFGSSTQLTQEEKFPILLRDDSSHFSKLFILDAHEQCLHNGIETTLAFVRRRYWITQGRKAVKNLCRKCVTCKKHRGLALRPVPTPDLPNFRIDYASRAFITTGLDFAGPLSIKICKCKTDKAYTLLLICASTRAIHLELVTHLSIPSFLKAFKRFAARRGTASCIINDNLKTFPSIEVKRSMATHGIKKRFILPASPWWGGFYERLVRTVKTMLKKVIGHGDTEELQTVLCEIEVTINSRPLTYQNGDDFDSSITPIHMIFGTSIHKNAS